MGFLIRFFCCPFSGMLTVDPKGRLGLDDLLSSEWITGSDSSVFSTTPLITPDRLSLGRGSVSAVQHQISATMVAFHKAHRDGFRLQDVTNAPLARRRKMKNSGSTDSSRSVTPVGSRNQSPCRLSPAKGALAPSPLVLESKTPEGRTLQNDEPAGAFFEASATTEAVPIHQLPKTTCIQDLAGYGMAHGAALTARNLGASPPVSRNGSSTSDKSSCGSSPHTSRSGSPFRAALPRTDSNYSLGFTPQVSSVAGGSSADTVEYFDFSSRPVDCRGSEQAPPAVGSEESLSVAVQGQKRKLESFMSLEPDFISTLPAFVEQSAKKSKSDAKMTE